MLSAIYQRSHSAVLERKHRVQCRIDAKRELWLAIKGHLYLKHCGHRMKEETVYDQGWRRKQLRCIACNRTRWLHTMRPCYCTSTFHCTYCMLHGDAV